MNIINANYVYKLIYTIMIIKGGITMLCNVKFAQFCARMLSCHRI